MYDQIKFKDLMINVILSLKKTKDVIQQQNDPPRFVLVEVYRTPDDPARHKETAHYQKWRDTVEEMMMAPRTSFKSTNVFPDEDGW